MGQVLGTNAGLLRFKQGGQAQDGGDIFQRERGDGKQGPRRSGRGGRDPEFPVKLRRRAGSGRGLPLLSW